MSEKLILKLNNNNEPELVQISDDSPNLIPIAEIEFSAGNMKPILIDEQLLRDMQSNPVTIADVLDNITSPFVNLDNDAKATLINELKNPSRSGRRRIKGKVTVQPVDNNPKDSNIITPIGTGKGEKRFGGDLSSIPEIWKFFQPTRIRILGGSLRKKVGLPLSDKDFFFVELKYKREGVRKRWFHQLRSDNGDLVLSEESLYEIFKNRPTIIDSHILYYRRASLTGGPPEDTRIVNFTPVFETDGENMKQALEVTGITEKAERLKLADQANRKTIQEEILDLVCEMDGQPDRDNARQWLESDAVKWFVDQVK